MPVQSGSDTADAIAFIVLGLLVVAAVFAVVALGKLPGRLARKWGHPQAAAIDVTSWVGIATGGPLWLVAFILAFTNPLGSRRVAQAEATSPDDDAAPKPGMSARSISSDKKAQP
jgi:Protein of unknown function (DUF3302)